MKTIIRNLLGVVRRFKMATLLNVMGLSIAFAAFIILMIQLQYDWGFDRFQKNAERIYRVGLYTPDWGNQVVVSPPFAEAFVQSSPHIETGALLSSWGSQLALKRGNDTDETSFWCPVNAITPEYASVFDFQMLEGKIESLDNPGYVLIAQSQAEKFFGDEPAVGKQLTADKLSFVVGGVYKDFPQNSVVQNAVYRRIGEKENQDNWNANGYQLYVLLDDPGKKDQIIADFKNHFNHEYYDWKTKDVRLTQLTDIYYEADARFDSQKDKGNKTMVFVLFTIAVLIVVIAGINFTNFSNALVPMRIRSINTQKVLGGSDNTLRCAMLVEAVAICLFSFILSLFIVKGMANTWLADMISGELSLEANIPLLIGAGILAALTGLLAGAYPAWHITSFSPALVLKGSFGLSPSGKRMRSLLVSFQYVISFALIIAALFIYLQNHYMLASSLGFDKEHVAIVELNGQLIKNIEAVENRLEQEVSVQEVSFAEDLLSASDEYTDFGRGYRENNVQFKVFVVSPDFLRLMNIPVISGRDFLQEDSKSVGGVYLFNEAARLQYDLVAGEYITGNEWYEAPPALIAGFIDDIKYASFRTEVAPMAFYVSPAAGYRPRYAYIKIKAGADIRDAVASIRKALTSIDKNFPAEIRFYDTILNNLYKRELSIGWLISLFSLIAVFISVVGVLGLVIFESEYRKKEIGLRKVHGATTSQILLMFNKVYVRILIVCFVLAIPVAYYGVNRWMVYFAYKIPMYWWVYAVAFVVVSVITFLTVTFQNWKTANENPVESIKTE
ncbi:ABC transporter permease [Parabacteroides sp. BX2]|jgi:putative ABC transport system permease protein|uniref:ABC transporter permease n=1 Tax=Parabacteroides segnis TaxID=2763058 RepID=A0ABR7E430_9BACT|nr:MULTISPECIES: ABC transporter permease [Parabacteroides]MBC5644531.1 ABC transporter permease [Parabacteroides segnis]MCM0714465.1 ABC transporter permease [Parabacteroides sp. TA-V-105]